MTIFIFGAGYSARTFARQYQGVIFGTTRNRDRFALLERAGIKPLLFNANHGYDDIIAPLRSAEKLIISIAPDRDSDIVLSAPHLLNAMANVKWIGYLSTIGVYGDHKGEWVDENAHCSPLLPRNAQRLKIEAAWQKFAKEKKIAFAILRLAGIYGPGRNAFLKLQQGKAMSVVKPGQVFNRIHSEDIAGALTFLSQNQISGVFNVTDDLPTPGEEVIKFAAQLMGLAPPASVPFDEADLSPMARSFYSENKRVSNARLKSIGYQFLYPNYKLALKTMWDKNIWQEE